MLGIGLSVPQIACSSTAFTPAALFAAGEQGAWYDPGDFSTMFQDSAGTTPVTAVEQPVGLIRDKSGRGNHASQATSGSQPVLSARVNQLTYSEQFDNTAAWIQAQANVTPNAVGIAAPDGTITADLILPQAINLNHGVYRTVSLSAGGYIISVYARQQNLSKLLVYSGAVGYGFDLTNGTRSAVTGVTAPLSHYSTFVGDGWYLCTITTSAAPTEVTFLVLQSFSSMTYLGNGTDGIYLWGADLRVTNDGVGLPVYQRIAAATDYNISGFPLYLRFDGSNDSLATAAINFSTTSKVTVWSGVRKLSDAAFQLLCELTAGSSTPDSFGLNVGTAAGDASRRTYGIEQYTSAGSPPTTTAGALLFSSPDTRVMTGQWDKAQATQTAEMSMRLNGVAQTLSFNNGNLGSGNFANDVLYIGRRGGTTAPLNARLYSLIVRGAQTTAAQVALTEAWINQRTKAY